MTEADQPSLLDVEPWPPRSTPREQERKNEPTEEEHAEGPSSLFDGEGATDSAVPAASDSGTSDALESPLGGEALKAGGSDPGHGLYYLTNRLNLNGILSSRIISPRDSYQKYYLDLLDRSRGWVPLLTKPPSRDLIDAVTEERGAGAPVLIELPRIIDGLVGSLENDVVFVAAVPLSQATAIHFRDQKTLREHRARNFSNVHPHDDLVRVTPHLFAGPGSLTWRDTPAGAAVVDWRGIDRLRGALSGAVASARSGEQLAIAAAALGASEIQDGAEAPGWLRLNYLPFPPRGEPDLSPGNADAVVFRSICAVLSATDTTDAWNRRDVLDAIQTEVFAAPRLTETDRALIARDLALIRAVVDVERDFEPFKATGDRLTSTSALLLVMLRPELAELLDWSERETGADDATQVVAGIFAGCLRGLARENYQLRSAVFDDLTAAWAANLVLGTGDSFPDVKLRASDRRTELVVEGQVLRAAPPLLPDPATVYRGLNEPGREALRLVVAEALGWRITTTVRVEGGASVEEDGDVLTLRTTGSVLVTQTYPESDFVERLSGTRGAQRREVLRLLTKG